MRTRVWTFRAGYIVDDALGFRGLAFRVLRFGGLGFRGLGFK